MREKSSETLGLHNCADEPIRIPGKVQPHGVFFAVSVSDLIIRHASLNAKIFFHKDAKDLIGKKIENVLGGPNSKILQEHLRSSAPESLNPSKIELDDNLLDVIIHQTGELFLVEFEKSSSREITFANIYRHINRTVENINKANSQQQMFEATVRDVMSLTHYDRIMIYKFDEEWNGKVVAEAKMPDLEPFLGLQYPASDIPAQARALYQNNWLRIIPDVSYEPSPIYPDGVSIDMSFSVLRSVSPIHIQYLKNMGVGASMSISIIKDGVLWGLIACHANEARYLSFEIRQGLEFIGKFFSAQLGAKEKTENLEYKQRLKDAQAALRQNMIESEQFLDGLHRSHPTLLDLVEGCTGAAIWFSGKKELIGNTPSRIQIDEMVDWLRKRKQSGSLFCTTQFSKLLPSALEYAPVASGILAIEIPEPEPAFVIWFKPEVSQTVNWSGNPEKAMVFTKDRGGLSPRRSFQLWQEVVRNRSLPWPPGELAIAEELRSSIVEVDLGRQVKAAIKSNEELDQFAHLVAHDLKEPLRNIQFFAEFISQDISSKLDLESQRNLSDIQALAKWGKQFVNELYEYSKIGKVDLSFCDVDLNEVIKETLVRYKALINDAKIEVKIPRPFPVVKCDRVRISEVFANLISNAIKYNDSKTKWIEIGFDDRTVPTTYFVKDNGIGIAPKDHSRLFKIFSRLHEREQYGGGTGSGLALTKRILERHSATIWVDSEKGSGTTFFFTLGPKR